MAVKTTLLRRAVFLVALVALLLVPGVAFADGEHMLGFDASIQNVNGVVSAHWSNTSGNGSISSTENGNNTTQVPAGQTVHVEAYPYANYEIKRIYYKPESGSESDITLTPVENNPNNLVAGSFTMPAENTTIGAVLQKKTYTVTVEFGSEHTGFVQTNFAGKAGLTVDGSTVKIVKEYESNTTPNSIASELYQYLPSKAAGYVDNNECIMTSNNGLLLGAKPRSQYTEQEYAYYHSESFSTAIDDQDTTLYALWAPPVGSFTLTLKPCQCGTTLQLNDSGYGHWEPRPYAEGKAIEGHAHITELSNILYSDWELERSSSTFTMKGGNSYPAHLFVGPDWGYYFPDDFANSMSLVGGEYMGSSDGGYAYRELKVSVPVKHIAPEGTKELAPTCTEGDTRTFTCTGCNESVTETADALGHDWGDPTYTWADDNSTCTATRVCKRDATHTETETVKATSAVTKEATATEAGTRTYTATFTNTAFAAQSKDVEIPAAGTVTYRFTQGAGLAWTKGSSKGATFTVKRSSADDTTLSHLTGVLVDGKQVPEDQRETKSGSVIITLKPSYLENLSVGSHKLEATFDDGTASTTFSVKAKSSSTSAKSTTSSKSSTLASTGDATNLALVSILVGIASTCLLAAKLSAYHRG